MCPIRNISRYKYDSALPLLFGTKPLFRKQWIVDADFVGPLDWINEVPEDIKLKTSNICAKVSCYVRY